MPTSEELRQMLAEQIKQEKIQQRIEDKSVSNTELEEEAVRKYGFFSPDIQYNCSKVKGELKVSISKNFRNSCLVLARIEPNISYSLIHQKQFLNGEPITPESATRLRERLIEACGYDLKKKDINEAIQSVAWNIKFNPIVDYFESLTDTGAHSGCLDTWLQDCMGAEDEPIIRIMGRKWLMSVVARGYVPGSYTEGTLILVAPDGGEGKSRLFQELCPSPSLYYEGSPGDLNNTQKVAQTLIGKLIVSFPELDGLDKHSQETNKRFLTTKIDTYVEKFENYSVEVPRTYVFAGETNNEYPLVGHGQRRMWCVVQERLDMERLLSIKNQLWFEAVQAYKSATIGKKPEDKDPWVLMEEERELFNTYISQFVRPNPMFLKLKRFFEDVPVRKEFYTADELDLIAKDLHGGSSSISHISSVLTENLGFTKERRVLDGHKKTVYIPAETLARIGTTIPDVQNYYATDDSPVDLELVKKRMAV